MNNITLDSPKRFLFRAVFLYAKLPPNNRGQHLLYDTLSAVVLRSSLLRLNVGARALAEKVLERYLGRRRTKVDENTIKTALKDELQKYCYRLTKRSPLILPILL